MIFHEIEMKGKFWVQVVTANPTWTTADKGRVIFNSTSGIYYVGGAADWEAMTTGGNGAYISATTADSHAGTITPTVDNSIDLGGSSYRYANVYAVAFQGTTTTATYADLAEKYTMDQKYPAGTLMTISEDESFEMTQSTDLWRPITGVISDKPAFIMNNNCIGQPVALVGKTPVRVTGPIEKGDYLCSNGDGTAVRTSGTMMAIALETNLDEDEKLVMCWLKL